MRRPCIEAQRWVVCSVMWRQWLSRVTIPNAYTQCHEDSCTIITATSTAAALHRGPFGLPSTALPSTSCHHNRAKRRGTLKKNGWIPSLKRPMTSIRGRVHTVRRSKPMCQGWLIWVMSHGMRRSLRTSSRIASG